MKTTDAIDYYKAMHTTAMPQLPGHTLSWLQDRRLQAIQHFYELGFPTRRDEEWKYTRVNALTSHNFHYTTTKTNDITLKKQHILPGSHAIVFVDGQFDAALSNIDNLPDGVVIMPLSQALQTFPEKLKPYLGQQVNDNLHAFNALNTAFFQDGMYCFIPKNCHLEKPIHIVCLAAHENHMSHLRHIVVAEPHSRATLVEQQIGLTTQPYLNNTIMELDAGPQANITHYKIQTEAEQGFHMSSTYIKQAKDSRVETQQFSFGGQLARSDTYVNLTEPGSNCILNGLYCLRDKQHVDHHTYITHASPHATSYEYYKGILNDSARAVFNGQVHVAVDAQKTSAHQMNKNLLLSPQAEVNTKPQLEIFADDVQCTHGATVGQLDDDHIFYLRSRGLPVAMAKQLLIDAFALDIIDTVTLPTLKSNLHQLLQDYHRA